MSSMNMQTDVSLKNYSTMRLGGTAKYFVEIHDRQEIEEAVRWAVEHQVPPLMIGGGSNIVWRDDGFSGLVLVNKILGYDEFPEDDQNVYITVGAGENWDSVVERSVKAGLTGIEALSLVPGTAGATPIQNVGAYGQEIADTLVSIEAYDLHKQEFVTIPAADCAFGYRTSRFKTVDRDRFFISSITLHLMKGNPQPPFYRAVTDYLATREHAKDTPYTPEDIRNAVIDIRSHKLPDPTKIANNGSFFANPLITDRQLAVLQASYPDMPHWPTDNPDIVKIPAAWLIEQSGFKDYHDTETGMATWQNQPLVLVNENARSTADLLKFKQKIIDAVGIKFDVLLEQEPELLP
jgi:UDP-N-acetylmuramate dehydrogenase